MSASCTTVHDGSDEWRFARVRTGIPHVHLHTNGSAISRHTTPVDHGPLPGQPVPAWLVLDEAAASQVEVAGGKASALARARRAGVDTLDGLVLTTAASRRHDAGDTAGQVGDLDAAFHTAMRLADGGPLVVRSSSVVEDAGESSAAGQFESVLRVRTRDDFADAIAVVYDSRERAGAADQPIAVLVQPMVEPDLAGVCFGVDPVSGRSDRIVVAVVRGLPDRLVSGEVDGARYELDRHGGVVEFDPSPEASSDASAELDDDVLVALADLEHRLAEVFDGPQDIEWALLGDRLVVLQSRPVTTEIAGVPSGPVFGPGPVAETFPEPLSTLEAEMWVPPLRGAVADALRLAGVATERQLADRELVVEIDGRVAIDLEITGEIAPEHVSLADRLSVRARVRRLAGAWRIGRLKATLPVLAERLADRVDADLERVPPMEELTSRQLVALLDRCGVALRSLHAHEMLMGLLTKPGDTAFTGASVALRVLAESRRDGFGDDDILARSPVVLALCAPRVGPTPGLPEAVSSPHLGEVPDIPDTQARRESLRLRVRWLQELEARAAWELGCRGERFGLIDDAEFVRHLHLDELAALVTRRAVPATDLLRRRARRAEAGAAPLPARFRLTERRRPVAASSAAAGGPSGGGTGAGGGVVTGTVTHDSGDLSAESPVLVVSTLSPGLGPVLPRLAGIVAETGSVLSHLAILAREQGVPIVVGCAGALQRFEPGMVVRVDGSTGEVDEQHHEQHHGGQEVTS